MNPEDVWAAVRDWGALHERLVPGFVVDTRLDGEDRIVTFANGTVLRELLVDLDDEARRLVWSVIDGPYAHHNASAQVFSEAETAPGSSGPLTSCLTSWPLQLAKRCSRGRTWSRRRLRHGRCEVGSAGISCAEFATVMAVES